MLPLILIPIGLAAVGTAIGAKGGADVLGSRERVKSAESELAQAQERLRVAYMPVQARAERYSEQQRRVHNAVVQPFSLWLDMHGASLGSTCVGMVKGEAPRGAGALPSRLVEFQSLAACSITAVAASAGVPSAAMGLATLFGTASTGASISTLSGVAATNASLAWLGGGSLAAGGGGMAAGQLLIMGAMGGVGVFAGGLGLLALGERSKTKSRQFRADVAVAVRTMQAQEAFAARIVSRIDEVSQVLALVSGLAEDAQRRLNEASPLDRDEYYALVERAVVLTSATAKILATPIVAADRSDFHANLDATLRRARRASDERGL